MSIIELFSPSISAGPDVPVLPVSPDAGAAGGSFGNALAALLQTPSPVLRGDAPQLLPGELLPTEGASMEPGPQLGQADDTSLVTQGDEKSLNDPVAIGGLVPGAAQEYRPGGNDLPSMTLFSAPPEAEEAQAPELSAETGQPELTAPPLDPLQRFESAPPTSTKAAEPALPGVARLQDSATPVTPLSGMADAFSESRADAPKTVNEAPALQPEFRRGVNIVTPQVAASAVQPPVDPESPNAAGEQAQALASMFDGAERAATRAPASSSQIEMPPLHAAATNNLASQPGGSPNELAGGMTRMPLPTPAADPRWAEGFVERIQVMRAGDMQRAEIKLNPAELGSIEVHISTENDQTSVVFYAQNRAARELLDAEMPRLREMLAQAGLDVGQSEVADGGARDRRGSEQPGGANRMAGNAGNTQSEQADVVPLANHDPRIDDRMIDYYV